MKRTLFFAALVAMSVDAFAADEANPCLKCTSPSGGSNSWDRQLHYELNTPMNAGENYQLKMKVKATANCDLAFWPIWSASPNRDQWGNSADVQYLDSYKVTTEWKTITCNFVPTFTHDMLQFVFGNLNGNLFVDDVEVKEVAVGVNLVNDGQFNERKTTGWSTLSYMNQQISIVDSEGGNLPAPGAPEIPDTYELAEQGNPHCHVFLAFGQSNMEGNAAVENQDKQNIPGNFLTVRAVKYSNTEKMGDIVPAMPPLCRPGTGLTPCDYFGRYLVEKLGDQDTVIVINVAVGGAKIELYMQEYKDEYIAGEAGWFQNYCAQYDNDPLGRLVAMGKIAQQRGVIEGVLLHQGESNNGQSDWADKVKEIHRRLCYYLGIRPEKTPLLAGETLYANMGGGCSWHNTAALPMIPQVMPGYGYVISADGLTGNGTDAWHFNAAGYREFGKRYGAKMYEIMQNSNSIEQINATATEVAEGTFDLCGRACEAKTSGFYIHNGKAVIVR